MSPALAAGFFTTRATWEDHKKMNNKMVGLYPNIMVILLDVNGLNTQIKRQDYVVIIIYVVCKIKQCNHHTNGLKKKKYNAIQSYQYM